MAADAGSTPDRARFSALTLAGVAVLAGVAIVAGVAVGAQYAIPFGVLALLLLGFAGFHRGLAATKTARYGDQAQDATAERGDDPVPHIGFDQQTAVGDSAEVHDEVVQRDLAVDSPGRRAPEPADREGG